MKKFEICSKSLKALTAKLKSGKNLRLKSDLGFYGCRHSKLK